MIMLRNTVSGKIVRFALIELFIMFFIFIVAGMSGKIHAASLSNSQKQELKSLFLDMLVTTDTSEHDISKYKIDSYTELRDIFDEVRTSDGELASFCYTVAQVSPVWSKGYITKVTFKPFENADDFDKNYEKIINNVDNILDGITPDMSDEDKVLYLHEALIDMTSYDASKMSYKYATGPLLFGRGNCNGYAQAYTYLLKRAGIESAEIENKGHIWNAVKLDGEWYHVDTTWDDPVSSADVDHKFFLKTDKEFQNDPVAADRHLNYAMKDSAGNNISASSTKYSDIFIHNVKNVGIMTYKDGYWYYSQDGKNYRGHLTDTEAEEIVDNTETENNESETPAPAEEEDDEDDEDDLSPWAMVIGAPTPSNPEHELEVEPEPEPIVEASAMFYLCKGSRTNYKSSNYIRLGKGTITKTERLLDDEDAINSALGNVPAYNSYLAKDQRVCWYSIKKESDGWHVDGQIVTVEKPQSVESDSNAPDEPEIAPTEPEPEEELSNADPETENIVEEEPVENEPVAEKPVENEPVSEVPTVNETIPEEPQIKTTKAKFYLCKGNRKDYRASNYISLGSGTITRTERLLDDEDAINEALGNVPDYSSHLSEGQRVCWYSIKKEGDGWHVDGQIISE